MNHNHQPPQSHNKEVACCHVPKKKTDWLLLVSTTVIVLTYLLVVFYSEQIELAPFLSTFAKTIFELINRMWWGLLLGILLVGFLAKTPKKFILALLGKGGSWGGILRATVGGVLLDLCSHGILLVGMQLYKKGASLGQTIAFLVASPWNSLSLTLILWALAGFQWMITLLIFSMVIAIISGFVFDQLVKRKILPENPNKFEISKDFNFLEEARSHWKTKKLNTDFFRDLFKKSWSESRMILRWIFLGVVLAALMRTFLSPENFQTFFGPTLAGLGLTVLVATVLEVCSEGSTPIAADILTRANAPGNAFAFLMTGVSTDYTEIISLKETTKSWKISLFLPLITVPQVIILAYLLNNF